MIHANTTDIAIPKTPIANLITIIIVSKPASGGAWAGIWGKEDIMYS